MGTSVKAVALTIISSTEIATPTPINPDGLDQACWMVRITNLSNRDLILGWTGSAPASEYIPAGQSIQIEAQTNSEPKAKVALFAKGTVFTVTSVLASSGNISLSGYYV